MLLRHGAPFILVFPNFFTIAEEARSPNGQSTLEGLLRAEQAENCHLIASLAGLKVLMNGSYCPPANREAEFNYRGHC